jgi:steroid delta-isomerase-like uncharacterized protein
MGDAERHIALLDRLWQLVNDREFDAAVAMYTPDAVLDMVGREVRGHEGIRRELADFAAAFPDSRNVPGRRIADASGNLVVEEWSVRGTHQGPFLGHPPTGQKAGFDAVTIYEFADGLIARDRTYADMTRLMLRTGVLQHGEAPAAAGGGA